MKISRICAVVDCATKYCLAATVAPTARGRDALTCLQAAVAAASLQPRMVGRRGYRRGVSSFSCDGAEAASDLGDG
jgi:hypothetical protein